MRYYVEVMLNETGIIRHRNNTYCKANKSYDEIIDENTEYNERLGLKSTEIEKALLIMYWIPKMHKNPKNAFLSSHTPN